MTTRTVTTCDHCNADISKADLKSKHVINVGSWTRYHEQSDQRVDPLTKNYQFCDLACLSRWLLPVMTAGKIS